MTIFSAPNYCNEFDNDGAMLIIKHDLCCFFCMNSQELDWGLGMHILVLVFVLEGLLLELLLLAAPQR